MKSLSYIQRDSAYSVLHGQAKLCTNSHSLSYVTPSISAFVSLWFCQLCNPRNLLSPNKKKINATPKFARSLSRFKADILWRKWMKKLFRIKNAAFLLLPLSASQNLTRFLFMKKRKNSSHFHSNGKPYSRNIILLRSIDHDRGPD